MKNTFVKVLSMMMALMMVVGMFSMISVSAAGCDHVAGGKKVDTVNATCQNAGYELWHCDDCGADYMLNYKPQDPDAHVLKYVEATNPECEKPGYSAHYVCTVEGCTYQDENKKVTAPALDHVTVKEKLAADCNKPERWGITCTVCEKYWEENIEGGKPATGHANKYTVTVEPTTCTDGKVTVKCRDCGITIAETITLAAKHDYKVVPNYTFACCAYKVKTGAPEGAEPRVCAICNAPDANTEKKATVSHSYTNDVVATGANNTLALADMNAKLEAAGYKIGESVLEVATCKKTGWRLAQCACGEYGKRTIPMSSHADAELTTEYRLVEGNKTLNAWTATEFQTQMDALIANKPCTAQIILITYCEDCDYVKGTPVEIAAAKADHKWKTEVRVAMSCVGAGTVGYSERFCEACGQAPVTTVDIKYVEHNWNAWTIGSQTCADAKTAADGTLYLTQTRTCKVCGDVDSSDDYENVLANAKIVTSKSHDYASGKTHEVVPTCAAGGATYKVCDDCGYKLDKVAGSDKPADPKNHSDECKADSFAAAEAAGTLQYTAPTCTTTGYAKYKAACASGVVFVEEVIPALQHVMPKGTEEDPYRDFIGADKVAGTRDDVQGAKVVPNCQNIGYEARPVCQRCGHSDVAQKPIEKNPNNHAKSYVVAGTEPATCQKNTIEYRNYECCGIKPVEVANSKVAHSYKMSGYLAPTCTEAGYHSHMWCEYCHAPKANDLKIGDCTCGAGTAHINLQLKGEYVIAATGHNFNNKDTKVTKVEEQCAVSGWAEYIKCANAECNRATHDKYAKVGTDEVIYCPTEGFVNPKTTQTTADDKYQNFYDACYIAPHRNNEIEVINANKASAPTCTADGVVSGTFCGKCKVYTADQTIKYWDVDQGKFVEETVTAGTSVKTVAKLGHSYNEVTVNAAGSAEYDCTAPTYTVKMCSRCPDSIAVDYEIGAATHTWGAYATLNYASAADRALAAQLKISINPCEDGVYKVRYCTVCGEYDEPVKTADKGKHQVTISGTTYDIDLSCGKIAEWDGHQCDHCNDIIDADADVIHREMVLTNYNDPNYDRCTVDGYFIKKCADCGVNLRTSSDPAEFTAKLGHKTNFANKEAAEAATTQVDYVKSYTAPTATANGTLVYVCKVCGEDIVNTCPATTVLNVTLKASAEKVAAGETFTVTYKLSGKAYEFAALNLQVNATNNVTLTGIESEVEGLYAVLSTNNGGISLIVANNAEGKAQTVKTTAEGDILFTLTFVANKTAATGNIAISVVDKDAALASANATVKVTAVGDLNDDPIVSAEDAQAIFAKIGTDDVAADVNLDGVVTLADVIALAKFAASAKTAADYLEMVGELDKLEDEVFAIYEAGRINDVNGDGIANIADAYELIAYIEEGLNLIPYYELNVVTMAELVALLNKYA